MAVIFKVLAKFLNSLKFVMWVNFCLEMTKNVLTFLCVCIVACLPMQFEVMVSRYRFVGNFNLKINNKNPNLEDLVWVKPGFLLSFFWDDSHFCWNVVMLGLGNAAWSMSESWEFQLESKSLVKIGLLKLRCFRRKCLYSGKN